MTAVIDVVAGLAAAAVAAICVDCGRVGDIGERSVFAAQIRRWGGIYGCCHFG